MHARFVTFDADNTLWNYERMTRYTLESVLIDLVRIVGARAGSLSVEKLMAFQRIAQKEYDGHLQTLETIRRRSFELACRDIGVSDDELPDFLATLYMRRRTEYIEIYPDVEPTLDRLSQNYLLGVISNGNMNPNDFLRNPFFSVVCLSEELGIEKPDPRAFVAAAEIAQVDVGESVHVGDSIEADVEGALGAGFNAVWLNRFGAVRPTSAKAYAVVPSLDMLPKAILPVKP